jgi:hypothetical protein
LTIHIIILNGQHNKKVVNGRKSGEINTGGLGAWLALCISLQNDYFTHVGLSIRVRDGKPRPKYDTLERSRTF